MSDYKTRKYRISSPEYTAAKEELRAAIENDVLEELCTTSNPSGKGAFYKRISDQLPTDIDADDQTLTGWQLSLALLGILSLVYGLCTFIAYLIYQLGIAAGWWGHIW